MANLHDICGKQGIAIEKLLDFAVNNLEASRQQISFLQQERETLSQKVNLQQTLLDADHRHFRQRLQTNELVLKERELTHAYEIAKTNLVNGTSQKDALLLKLRLDSALDDLEEFQTQYELLMLELKGEQAKAQALNKALLEKKKEPVIDQSQIILEVEQRTRRLQESLLNMEKDHRNEISKEKSERKRISSLWRSEVSALLRERDFVWNQLRRMEEVYADRLKCKNEQLQVASENIEKLRLAIEELQKENIEKNLELTIMKVELGEKEREAQLLKENVLKNSKPNQSLQVPRPAVKMLTKSKERGMEVLSMDNACCAGTSKESSELNAVYETCSQEINKEINTEPQTLTKKDIIYFENIQNKENKLHSIVCVDEKENNEKTFSAMQLEAENAQLKHKEENKLHSIVCMDEKETHEKTFSALQLEAENAQLKDKEVPDKDSATSINNICCCLNTELNELAVGSDLIIQPPTNEPLLNESPHGGNNKVAEGMDFMSIQTPLGRHEKSALKCDGNGSFKDPNSTREIIRNNSSNKRRRGADKSISLVKSSLQFASWEKRNLRPRGKQSDEVQQPFGQIVKYNENLHPVRANFFPSSFCIPKVKGISPLSSFR